MNAKSKSFFSAYLPVLILITWLLGGCSEKKPDIQTVSGEEAAEINAIGSQAAALLMKTLQKELLTAIQQKGVPGAIDICRRRALKLTDSLSSVTDRIDKIKRTSTKIRNPLNKADLYEEEALQYFSERYPDNLPEYHIQKLTDEKGPYYRFYKPLQVNSLCLACHGPKETMGSDLAVKLKTAYPEDQATGYQVDDFRGLVSITIR